MNPQLRDGLISLALLHQVTDRPVLDVPAQPNLLYFDNYATCAHIACDRGLITPAARDAVVAAAVAEEQAIRGLGSPHPRLAVSASMVAAAAGHDKRGLTSGLL